MQYLVIEGNIGAGKTTLATRFAQDLNAKLVLERFAGVDRPKRLLDKHAEVATNGCPKGLLWTEWFSSHRSSSLRCRVSEALG